MAHGQIFTELGTAATAPERKDNPHVCKVWWKVEQQHHE